MIFPSRLRHVVFVAAAISGPAAAQENENAVPLFLGLEPASVTLEAVGVKINGRIVTVATKLKNTGARAQHIGWYASTPQFGILGTGEEHLDKSFADVRATINSRPSKAQVYQRGFFLGRDITAELTRVGLPALPDLDADTKKLARLALIHSMRLDQWQGYASYAWTASVAAGAEASIEIKYRALPSFALNDVASDDFINAVKQHCGDPDTVIGRIRTVAGAIGQVIVERYEVPIGYMRIRDVNVSIAAPGTNWLRGHPIVSLACGLANASQRASVDGTISNASALISVLMVSAPETLSSSPGGTDASR